MEFEVHLSERHRGSMMLGGEKGMVGLVTLGELEALFEG